LTEPTGQEYIVGVVILLSLAILTLLLAHAL
jgi:hypothetical protein